MKKLAVIYHSAHGHTEHIARHVAQAAGSVAATEVHVLEVEDLTMAPEVLVTYDGLILGSPTYLGGVSGQFKTFMDSTGPMWRNQQLKGKLAAGFTVSSLPGGGQAVDADVDVDFLHAARNDLGRKPLHARAAPGSPL